jgi:hypothetical protein
VCTLACENKYDLTTAYPYSPHVEFLNLKTDNDLKGFVKWWGPLTLSGKPGDPESSGDKRDYWNFQGELRALYDLTKAFRSQRKTALQNAILEFVAADDKVAVAIAAPVPGYVASSLSARFLPADLRECHPRDWVPHCDMAGLRRVAKWCIEDSSVTLRLAATWKPGPPKIGWKPDVETLQDAIRWMFWQDSAGGRQLMFCQDCQTAFLPESAHARKFCSQACAHRSAVRESWKRSRNKAMKRGKHAQAKKA